MAPSSTRIRVPIRSRKAARALVAVALTTADSGSDGGLHRGPQAQQVTNREDEVGAIHCVEMERGDAAIDKIEHLLRSDCGGNQLTGRCILVEALKSLGEPDRDRSPAAPGKAGGGLEILHRQNAGNDRNIDAP